MKKQTENDIKKAIKRHLEYQGYTVYRINNAGTFNKKRDAHIFHGTPGFPDLIALKKGRNALFIETKAPGKKPGAAQLECLELASTSLPPIGLWFDSFDEFLRVFERK